VANDNFLDELAGTTTIEGKKAEKPAKRGFLDELAGTTETFGPDTDDRSTYRKVGEGMVGITREGVKGVARGWLQANKGIGSAIEYLGRIGDQYTGSPPEWGIDEIGPEHLGTPIPKADPNGPTYEPPPGPPKEGATTRFGKQVRQYWDEPLKKVEPEVGSIYDIKDPEGFFKWGAGALGQMGAQVAITAPFMLQGRAVQMAKVAPEVAKTTLGKKALSYLVDWAKLKPMDVPIAMMEGGEILGGQIERFEKGETRELSPLRGLAAIFIASKFEELGTEKATAKLLKFGPDVAEFAKKGLWNRISQSALTQMLGEGSEEFFQAYAEQYGIDPSDLLTRKQFLEAVDAAAAGAVGGFGIGGATGAIARKTYEAGTKDATKAGEPVTGELGGQPATQPPIMGQPAVQPPMTPPGTQPPTMPPSPQPTPPSPPGDQQATAIVEQVKNSLENGQITAEQAGVIRQKAAAVLGEQHPEIQRMDRVILDNARMANLPSGMADGIRMAQEAQKAAEEAAILPSEPMDELDEMTVPDIVEPQSTVSSDDVLELDTKTIEGKALTPGGYIAPDEKEIERSNKLLSLASDTGEQGAEAPSSDTTATTNLKDDEKFSGTKQESADKSTSSAFSIGDRVTRGGRTGTVAQIYQPTEDQPTIRLYVKWDEDPNKQPNELTSMASAAPESEFTKMIDQKAVTDKGVIGNKAQDKEIPETEIIDQKAVTDKENGDISAAVKAIRQKHPYAGAMSTTKMPEGLTHTEADNAQADELAETIWGFTEKQRDNLGRAKYKLQTEEIEAPPSKKGYVSSNGITLGKAPNGTWTYGYNINIANGGHGWHPGIYERKQYDTREAALLGAIQDYRNALEKRVKDESSATVKKEANILRSWLSSLEAGAQTKKAPAKKGIHEVTKEEEAAQAKAKKKELPPHTLRKITTGDTYKGGYMATVTEGPHKDVIGVAMTERGARDDLMRNIKEREKIGSAAAEAKEKTPKTTKKPKAITEDTPFPCYTFFKQYRYFLPLLQKIRKGQDLAGGSDSRWNSFVQLFNEAMNNGEIPMKQPPSGLEGQEPGTVEWTESEVFDLITDEMARFQNKGGQAQAHAQEQEQEIETAAIPLTDEQLQDDGFIPEKDIEAIVDTTEINIIGLKEELNEEGFSDTEIGQIVSGLEAASDNQIAGKEFAERLAALKEQVKKSKTEQPATTTDGELFNTNDIFTLSGNQSVKQGEFKTTKEPKAELFSRPKPVFQNEREKEEEQKKKLAEALAAKNKPQKINVPPTEDLSKKSINELVTDAFDIINHFIEEDEGKVSDTRIDYGKTEGIKQELYQKLRPILEEIAKRATTKGLDVKAYLFGAVDAQPEGKAKQFYEAAAAQYAEEQNKPVPEVVKTEAPKGIEEGPAEEGFAWGPVSSSLAENIGDVDVELGARLKKLAGPRFSDYEAVVDEIKKAMKEATERGETGKANKIKEELRVQTGNLRMPTADQRAASRAMEGKETPAETTPETGAKKPPFGPTELLGTIPDKKNNLEIFVAGNINGGSFSVSIRDNDTMEFLPTVRIFPSEKLAWEVAGEIAQGKKAKIDPPDDWRNHLIKARMYALMLGVPFEVDWYTSKIVEAIDKKLMEDTAAKPGEPPKGKSFDMNLSERIRDKTLEKVKPYLNPNNSETALLATIEKAADEAYGEIVDEILGTNEPVSTTQKVYLDTWDKKSFAEAVLKYIKRHDLMTKKQEAEAPKETPKPEVYKTGDRIVITGAYHNATIRGRHGVIKAVGGYTMTPIFGGQSSHTVTYEVETDNGLSFPSMKAEDLERETGPLAGKLVKDIYFDNRYQTPENVFGMISYSKKHAQNSREAATRARKDSNRASHLRVAASYDKDAQKYRDAFDAWASQYPEEAEKIRPATKEQPPQQQTALAPETGTVTGTSDAYEKLKSVGLTLVKTTTKNGHPVWNLGGNTRNYKDAIKKAKGIWYGPKKVWSFYGTEDPAEKIIKAFDAMYSHPDTVPWQSKKGEQGKSPLTTGRGSLIPKSIGKNKYGQEIFEDEKGVRSIMEGPIRITEPVGLTPTRNGITFDVERKDPRFLTTDENTQTTTTPNATTGQGTQPVQPQAPVPSPTEERMGADKIKAARSIMTRVDAALANQEVFTREQLMKWGEEAYGGTIASGAFTWKDLFDAMELGINRYLGQGQRLYDPTRGMVIDARDTIDHIREHVLDKIPSQHGFRTKEMDEYQQFSTPPDLAYLMAWVANIKPGETVLEPSAGVGGLAVFARNAGAKVCVNELSQRRASLLRQMGFGQVFTENGEQIDNILPDHIKPTVIIMNPPFSATAGRMQGRRSPENLIRHISQALSRLEPGGRLVVLTGKGLFGKSKTFNEWLDNIDVTNDVIADITISGEGYKKYGTTYDNRLIVIDKTKTNATVIQEEVSDIKHAAALLKGVRDARNSVTEQPSAQPGSEEVSQGSRPVDAVLPPAGGGTVERGQGTAQQRPGPGSVPVLRGDGGAGTETGLETAPEGRGPGGSERTAGDLSGRPGVGGSRPADEHAGSGRLLTPEPALTVQQTEEYTDEDLESGNIFEEYTPSIKIEGAQPHPAELVESAAMATVKAPKTTYVPNIDKKLVETGALSDVQLEAITMSGQAHGEVLDSGVYLDANGNVATSRSQESKTFHTFRKGFFIGDGTGVGKGREIAGIILDNWNRGRRRALWISQNTDLIHDAKRDLVALGMDPKLVIDYAGVKFGQPIKQKEGILFISYDTLKYKKGVVRRIDPVVAWAGQEFDGVIAFDESHNMGNALSTRGRRGTKKPSMKAVVGVELQSRLYNSRTVYASATGATEVANLSYCDHLGLWGKGTPFSTKRNFIEQISGAGIAGMEMIAQCLKAMGSYSARNLSFDGVKYETIEHELTENQKAIYDEMARSWQIVLQNIHAALQATGITGTNHAGQTVTRNGNARKNVIGAFWGAHQRFFNQIITSMQTPTVIKAIEKNLADGDAAVVQLVNTNEAQTDRAMAKREEGERLEDLDLTPREGLMNYLENSFPIQQYEEYTDDNGNIRSRLVLDSSGNPVINREAVAMRDALLRRLGMLKVPDASLDMIIRHFGIDRAAEATGRSKRLVDKTNDQGGNERVVERWSKAKGLNDIHAFMHDKKKLLVFSDAAGTGRSFHADKTEKNQRLRHHYLLQPGWRADRAIQGLGRTHRSNQKQPPYVHLVTTNLKGQKRFISSIARRLEQLGSLTKGQRDTATQGIFKLKDNLENSHARQAFIRLIHTIFHGGIENLSMAEFEQETGMRLTDDQGQLRDDIPEITQFLNRLLSLTVDRQEEVFNAFDAHLDRIIEKAAADGTLDAGMETILAKGAKRTREEIVYTGPQGEQTKYNEIELSEDAVTVDFQTSKMWAASGYVVNKKSGVVWAANRERITTDTGTGEMTAVVTLTSPRGTVHVVEAQDLKDGEKYERIDDMSKAEALWGEQHDKVPKTKTRKIHLITGALLPIWDRLPQEHVRVMRLKLNTGEKLLGRLIPDKSLNGVLKKLNVDKSTAAYTPEQAYNAILDNGETIQLANDWTLKRVKTQGMDRIEVTGETLWRFESQLEHSGALIERISYKTRVFIPTGDDGIAVMKEILAISPIFDVEGGGGALTTSIAENKLGYGDEAQEQGALFNTDTAGSERPFRRTAGPVSRQQEVVTERIGSYRAGTNKIENVDDVGQIARNLLDDPQETFAAILIKDDGTVHSVHRISRGGIASSIVQPVVAVGQALNTEGVTGLWFIHNHPSGVAELSPEDKDVGSRLVNLAQGSGVTVHGIMAVTPTEYAAMDYMGAVLEKTGKMPKKRQQTETIPVVERRFSKQKTGRIQATGPALAVKAYNQAGIKANNPNITVGFFDIRNKLISTITIERLSPIRGEIQRMLLQEADRRNATNIAIYAPQRAILEGEAKNIANFGRAAGLAILDIIDAGFSMHGRGMLQSDGSQMFFKLTTQADMDNLSFDIRPPKTPRFSVDQVRQFLALPLKQWKNVGKVQVIKTARDLPARFMRYVQEGDTIFGAYDQETDTTYIIADSIPNARAAIVTLMHEAVGHRGITAILRNADVDLIWQQIVKAYQGTPLMDRIVKGYGQKMGTLRLPLDLNDKDDRRIAVNEFIAHMAEAREATPAWTRVVGIIRAALRRIAPNLTWSDADILHLIDRARTYSGVMPKATTGTYFKKGIEGSTTGSSVVDDLLRQIETLAPPDPKSPPLEIKGWVRDHAKAAAATIMAHMPGNLPHAHFLERVLKNPLWYEHPVLKQLFNVMAHHRQETYHELFYDFNDTGKATTVSEEVARLRKTDRKSYEDLSRILIVADAEWVCEKEWTFEDRIKNMKVSEDVKRVALLIRSAFDKMLDARQAPMKELLKKLEEQGYEEDLFALDEEGTKNFHVFTVRPTKEFDSFWTASGKERQERAGLPYHEGINYIVGHSRAGGMEVQAIHFSREAFTEETAADWWNDHKQFFRKAHRDYKAELRQTIMGALQVMDQWRGYYFPRLRKTGPIVITAYKEDEFGDRQYIHEHGSKYWSELRSKELELEGYKEVKVRDSQRLPESIYLNIRTIDVQKSIDYAVTGMKSTTSADILAKFNEDLIEQAVNMIRERGIESTKIHRILKGRVVKGYIEDPIEAYLRYTSGVAGGMAKGEVSQKATELLRQIDPTTEAKAYDTAKRYIEENLRNVDTADRVMAYAKAIATLKFLGFNPRSAVVNLTAMVTSAPAAIHQYAGGGKVSMVRVHKEIAHAGRTYAKHMVGKTLEAEDQIIAERITREGYDAPQLTRDALGAMQGGLERSWDRMMNVAMFMFSKTEQWNRGTTILAAYKVAKQRFEREGLAGEELVEAAYSAAIEATDKAHAAYGKANLPEWAQGTSASARVGQAMYVYGNFGHNYVQLLYDLGAKKHNIVGFTWALAAPVIIAGGAAWPFKDELLWLINGMLRTLGIGTGVDKFVWDKTRKHLGEQAEVLGRRGIFGLAGVDISGSLGIGLGIPTGLLGLTGAMGGVAEDIQKASHFVSTGQIGRALEKTLPTAASNILRGIREARTGVTTEKSRVLWDKGGKPYRPTAGETAARIIGFQSSRQSVARERSNEMYQAEQGFLKRKDALYEELRAWAVDPKRTNAGLTRIYKKQGEYNKALIDARLAGRVPLIRSSEMSRQIKGVMVPSKKDFLRQQR
jgi:hypothetical protein